MGEISEEGSSLLFYSGAGGVGKSALVRYLEKFLSTTTKGIAFKYINYDFADGVEMINVLNTLKEKLKSAKAYFPLFEKGYLYYYIKSGNIVSNEQIKSVLNNSSVLHRKLDSVTGTVDNVNLTANAGKTLAETVTENSIEFLDELSDVSTVLKAAKLGIGKLNVVITRRAQKAKAANDEEYNEILRELEERNKTAKPESIKEFLPVLFARDLSDWLNETNSRLVIFLDTYEKLTNDERDVKEHVKLVSLNKEVPADWWVEEIILGTSRILWVIAGRSEIEKIGTEIEIVKGDSLFPLAALEDNFANEFLEKSGVQEDDLRRGIVKATGGYPNFLNACVETYNQICLKGNVPSISDFGKDRSEIVMRLLGFMNESSAQTVRRLAILGMWTDTVAAKILTALNEYNPQTYGRIKKLSFISADSVDFEGKTVFGFDRSIQRILIDHCKEDGSFTELLPQTRDAANNFFRSVFKDNSERNSIKLNQYFKFWYEIILRTTAAAELVTQYEENFTATAAKFDKSVVETLINEFRDKVEDELGTENIPYAYFDHLLAKVKLSQDRLKEALELAEFAYDKFEHSTLNENQAVLKISVISVLADVYEELKRTADEINLREQAVAESEKIFRDKADDHIIKAKENLVHAFRHGDKENKSLEILGEIFHTLEFFNDERTMKAADNYAGALERVSKYKKALPLREKIVDFYRKTNQTEEFIFAIRGLVYLLDNFSTPEYLEKKLKLQNEQVTFCEKFYGEYSSNVSDEIEDLCKILIALGRREEAVSIQENRVEKFKARLETLENDAERVDFMEDFERFLRWSDRPEEVAKISEQIKQTLQRIVEDKTKEPVEDYDAAISAIKALSAELNTSEYRQDVELRRKILELTENKPGVSDDEIIDAMKNLAYTLALQKTGCDEALVLREKIVERLKEKFPDDETNEKIVDAIDDVAFLLENSIKDYVGALSKRKEILKLLEVGNADEKKILYAMKNIADLYGRFRLENYPEELIMRKQILDFCNNNFLPDAPEVIEAMENLAYTYESLQDYDEAEKLRTEIATLKGTKRGDDSNSDVISAKEKVADRLHDAGKYDEELEVRQEIVELYRKNYEDNTDVGQFWNNITIAMGDVAGLLDDLGRDKEAREIRKNIVDEYKKDHAEIIKELGEKSDKALDKMKDIADSLRDVENFDEELEYRKKIVELRESVNENSEETIDALDKLADFFKDHDNEDEAFKIRAKIAEILKKILDERISVFTKDHEDTISVMEDLAIAERDLGHYEEEKYWRKEMLSAKRRIAEKREATLGKNHPKTIEVWQELAKGFWREAYYKEELAIRYDILARLKEIYPDGDENILNEMKEIAYSFESQNNYPAALGKLQEILAAHCAEKNGETSDEALNVSENIAWDFDKLGDYRATLQVRHEIEELYRKKFGNNNYNSDIIRAMDKEANTLNQLKDYESELSLRLKIVDLYAKRYGENGYKHDDTIDKMDDVVRVLVEMKKYDQAVAERENIVALFKEKYEEKHEKVREAMDNLAELLEKKDDLEGALNQRLEIYEICKKNFGEDNEELTIPAMNNVAEILERKEDYEEALTWRRKIVDLRLGNYDVNATKRRGWRWIWRDDISRSIYDLADTLEKLERYDEAKIERERVVDEIQNQFDKTLDTYGRKSDKTVEKLEELIEALSRVERHEDEIKNRELLAEILTEFKGEFSEKTLEAMDYLSDTYERHDLADKALEVREKICVTQQKILDSRVELFGNEHKRTIDIREKLANTLEQLDRSDEANVLREENLQAHEAIVNKCVERFTELSDITLDAMQNFAQELENLSRYDDAEKVRRRIVEIYEEIFPDDKTNEKIIDAENNLAKVLRNKEDFDAATVEQIKLVGLLKEKYKDYEFYVDVINALEKLANIYAENENFDAAITVRREIIDLLEEKYKGYESHSDVIRAKDNLAYIYAENKNFDAAIAIRREIIDLLEEKYKGYENHSDVISAKEDLENLLEDQANYISDDEEITDDEDFEIDVSNSIALCKGQKFDLTKNNPQLSSLKIIFGWNATSEFDIDYSAYLLGGNGKVKVDEDFIFYNNPVHTSGGVEYVENSSQIKVELEKIPDEIARVAFTLTIYDADKNEQNFSQIEGAYISVVDVQNKRELLRFELTQNFSVETAVVAGEIYRYKGTWKFNAIGAGFSGGLEALCKNFGVEIE